METVVVIEGKLEDSGVGRSSSALSSPKQIANPIVYKLVRIEDDGRLVPATDDEVIEVEDFLEYGNGEMQTDANTGQNVECISIERSSSRNLQLERLEGLSQSDNEEEDQWKIEARLQYIEQMLQKVKQEERLHLACKSPGHSYVNIDNQCCENKLPVVDGKLQSEIPSKKIIPSLALGSNNSHSNLSGSTGQCSRPSEGLTDSESSALAVFSSLTPDFSMLKGEMCLDSLSITDLHELFEVTFGRKTNVKDKQWLKRRISMSLTNSCDVSTSFVVEDNKLVKRSEEDSCGNVDTVLSRDTTAEGKYINCKDLSNTKGSKIEDNQVVPGNTLKNHVMEHDLENEDPQTEQRAAKRIRKPTKRYIELRSENEFRDHHLEPLNSNNNLGVDHVSLNSSTRPARNVSSEGRTVITRLDSLGGFEIYVPCVSRVRTSRPRKNIMSLMPAAEPEKNKLCSVMDTIELRQELKPEKADSASHTSDDNVVTIPTAEARMRRKHHRAWSLIEVMKLVEGVSRCGAGKWSEIKRLAFSSSPYRTSVDLKDKWRNLLKASLARVPANEGINFRKQGIAPIPESILVRVRQLAELNSQVPPNVSSNKPSPDAGCRMPAT